MWMWVKADDGFGQSLLRIVRWLALVCFLVGVALGAATLTAWVAVHTLFAPIVRF